MVKVKKHPEALSREADLYGELARVYTRAYDWDLRQEVAFYRKQVELHGTGKLHSVLEPACGSGRYLPYLFARPRLRWRQTGVEHYTGYDISGEMLDLARSRARKLGLESRTELLTGEMSRFRLDRRFDLIFIGINSFRYLVTEEEAEAFFRNHWAMLHPGQLLILDFNYGSPPGTPVPDVEWVLQEGDRRIHICWKTPHEDYGTLTDHQLCVVNIRERDGTRKTFTTHHHQRLWTPEAFRKILRRQGLFSLVGIYDYEFRPVAKLSKYPGDLLNLYHVLKKSSG